ncbi:hypothetical protein [Kordia sp.]|uniref:hypothetical protein n=1 Tax=Kordia sp. TaxID=1965332 RepID=UPI003D26C7A9
MIVYGTSSKDLGTRKIQGAKCPNCEASGIYVNAISRYATVFWIPVFPYTKKYFSVCKNCEQVLQKKEMPQQLKDKLEMEKHHFKTPFYLFSGLIIIVLFIGYAFYASGKHDEELTKNVNNLQAKDIIVFKVSSKEYTFAEVDEHSNDTIYMKYSNYSYEGRKPSENTFKKERESVDVFFDDSIYFFTQKGIDSLYTKGEIVEIYTNK